MSHPILLSTYPANGDTGIPVGESIVLSFDQGVDLSTIKDFIVLYGRDFDQTSGAESQLWIDADTGDNPFLLRSPGLKGLVDVRVRAVYYDIDSDDEIDISPEAPGEESSYGVAGAGHRVYITPDTGQFAPDTQYTLQILGDTSTTGTTGVCARTVFEVAPDVANVSSTGIVYVTGGYTGSVDDTLFIQVLTSGDIGTAKYKFWLGSAGAAEAITDKLTNRKYRNLMSGLQVRFSGTGFVADDVYAVVLSGRERMSTSTKIVFTTNDGSYSVAPDSPSTPAISGPPASTVPPVPGASTAAVSLQVEEMSPPDGAFNIPVKTRLFTIVFSDQLDATTITPESVRVFTYPVLGYFQGQSEPRELLKKLTVSGQILTIEV